MSMQIIPPWPQALASLAPVHRSLEPIFWPDFGNGIMHALTMALELVFGRKTACAGVFLAFEGLDVSGVVASGRFGLVSEKEEK